MSKHYEFDDTPEVTSVDVAAGWAVAALLVAVLMFVAELLVV